MWSPDICVGEDEDPGLEGALTHVAMKGRRGYHEWESKRQNDTEHRFKPSKVEAYWLKGGLQEADCTMVMMSVLKLESGSDVKKENVA